MVLMVDLSLEKCTLAHAHNFAYSFRGLIDPVKSPVGYVPRVKNPCS